MDVLFLKLDEVLRLHQMQLAAFGGSSGIRDLGLLQSAMGNVEATFAGEYLHQTVYEMGAAYLYGICRNHPFVDGNKRTAVAATLTFLDMNRVNVEATDDELYELTIGVAEGRVTKDAVASFFEDHSSSESLPL